MVTKEELENVLATGKDTEEYRLGRYLSVNSVSLLHPDVLFLLTYLQKYNTGSTLEIGPQFGGSTIALSRGTSKKVYTIEKGGTYSRPHEQDKDIITELNRNLFLFEATKNVQIVQGESCEEFVLNYFHHTVPKKSIGLVFIDADGEILRDLCNFHEYLQDEFILIVDDYSTGCPHKSATVKRDIDDLPSQELGVYGWGTWFGKLNSTSRPLSWTKEQ